MTHDKILRYIETFWDEAITPAKKSKWGSLRNVLMHIGRVDLPYAFVSPNNKYFAGAQYYWDSYFTIIGLLDQQRDDVAKGMVDNLLFLHKKFGFVPARNTILSFGRSQPPLLTSMIWEVYDSKAADETWLDGAMNQAVQEYEQTWASGRRCDKKTGLSTYKPFLFRKVLTVYESGWDVSSRFAFGKTTLLPIDLNSMLYKYEVDIARWHALRKRTSESKKWHEKAKKRAKTVSEYCWDERTGFFYDYDTQSKRIDPLATVAGYLPLWAGLATKKQAEKAANFLETFMQPFGIASSQELTWNRRQWDYPNGWPPLHLFVIVGLLNYDKNKSAQEIAKKWQLVQEKVFDESGKLWEKYDVARGAIGRRGRYKTQSGFSWTAGVYIRLHTLMNNKKAAYGSE